MDFYGAKDSDDEKSFKCIRCGEINLVSVSKKVMEEEEREEWNITSTVTARRKFKELCAKKGKNFNDGLLYLIALEAKEELGKLNVQTPFGVPGTSK